MSKILTACFSPTGTTKRIAQMIAEAAQSDFFEIKPAIPYTSADLNWNDNKSRSSLEMNDKSSRPKIADKAQNINEYKIIFLGFPIWWYEAPRIIHSFLDGYDFANKSIIPFATSGSSGLGSTEDILKKSCPAANWLPGKRFPGNASKEDVAAWAKEFVDWKA